MTDIALKYNTAAEAFDFVLPANIRVAGGNQELIADGTFDTLGVWISHNANNADLSIDAGRLKVTRKFGASLLPIAFRPFQAVMNHTYQVSVECIPFLTNEFLSICPNPNFDNARLILNSTTQQTVNGSFQADFTGTHYVYLAVDTFVAEDYGWFDNVSIMDTTSGVDVFQSTGFVADGGLETAVVMSLYCDRVALINDSIPDGTTNRRGWWADAYPRIDGDLIGSRLWLLDREKVQKQVLLRAREYALEALQWMIDDGIARSVEVSASVLGTHILGLDIAIARRDGGVFRKLWEVQLERN